MHIKNKTVARVLFLRNQHSERNIQSVILAAIPGSNIKIGGQDRDTEDDKGDKRKENLNDFLQ